MIEAGHKECVTLWDSSKIIEKNCTVHQMIEPLLSCFCKASLCYVAIISKYAWMKKIDYSHRVINTKHSLFSEGVDPSLVCEREAWRKRQRQIAILIQNIFFSDYTMRCYLPYPTRYFFYFLSRTGTQPGAVVVRYPGGRSGWL